MNWIRTVERPPPEHQVVLGWWADYAIATVVRRGSEFFAPGYPRAEVHSVPLFWSYLPDPPRMAILGIPCRST